MAARIRRIGHNEKSREAIQTTQLVKRLTSHVLGKVDMSTTQVTAALGLLKKTLPDMSHATGDINVTTSLAGILSGLPDESTATDNDLEEEPSQVRH